MNFLLNLIFLFGSILQTYGADIDCSENSRMKANVCGEKLFFAGQHSRPYPETDQQLIKHCGETTELVKCVAQYTDNCHKGIHRPISSVMLSTVRRNQRTYCLRSTKRQELLSMASCGNAIRDDSTKCMDQFLLVLGQASFAERRFKIPHGCCSFFQLKTCVLKSAERQSKCTQTKLQQLERYIDAMAGNTVNLICGQYDEDSDRCVRLPALPSGPQIYRATDIINGFGRLLH